MRAWANCELALREQIYECARACTVCDQLIINGAKVLYSGTRVRSSPSRRDNELEKCRAERANRIDGH